MNQNNSPYSAPITAHSTQSNVQSHTPITAHSTKSNVQSHTSLSAHTQAGSASSNSSDNPAPSAPSSTIENILVHNQTFVEQREYERYTTDKYPDKKLAIVSCMDTRLTELLAAALGLKNGDAKIIKVAGAEVAHPFGSVMRSLLIAVCELGVEDIMIVSHTNCGAQHMSGSEMTKHMQRLGVSTERISLAHHCGIDFDRWLAGFGDTEEAVRRSVDMVRNHPVMPPHIRVGGYIMNSDTGELSVVC